MVEEALSDRGAVGRFTGQPLLNAIQPLLEQQALPAERPKLKQGRGKRGGEKRGAGKKVPAARNARRATPTAAERRPRGRRTKFRYGRIK